MFQIVHRKITDNLMILILGRGELYLNKLLSILRLGQLLFCVFLQASIRHTRMYIPTFRYSIDALERAPHHTIL